MFPLASKALAKHWWNIVGCMEIRIYSFLVDKIIDSFRAEGTIEDFGLSKHENTHQYLSTRKLLDESSVSREDAASERNRAVLTVLRTKLPPRLCSVYLLSTHLLAPG